MVSLTIAMNQSAAHILHPGGTKGSVAPSTVRTAEGASPIIEALVMEIFVPETSRLRGCHKLCDLQEQPFTVPIIVGYQNHYESPLTMILIILYSSLLVMINRYKVL